MGDDGYVCGLDGGDSLKGVCLSPNSSSCIWKSMTSSLILLHLEICHVLITREKLCNSIWGWMLTGLIVVIISTYIQTLNHYVVPLKLI